MAVLTISGESASRFEDVAHCAAQRLGFELITSARMAHWMAEEFGSEAVPDRAWCAAAASIVARLATKNHLVVALSGAESLFESLPQLLRAGIVATDSRRVGNLMLSNRLDRLEAMAELARLDAETRLLRKTRFGRSTPQFANFDLTLSAHQMDADQMTEVLRATVTALGLAERGFLSPVAEAQIQFQLRLDLARHGIAPAGRAQLKTAAFGHPSEEMFANLLDFYRIQWQYEPRSFALQWDKDGNPIESFTPDFYLPELDLYLELTTMKQALVTRKNRKVKMLRAVYPHVNIQVFYQKDFQDLVFKYGLRMPAS